YRVHTAALAEVKGVVITERKATEEVERVALRRLESLESVPVRGVQTVVDGDGRGPIGGIARQRHPPTRAHRDGRATQVERLRLIAGGWLKQRRGRECSTADREEAQQQEPGARDASETSARPAPPQPPALAALADPVATGRKPPASPGYRSPHPPGSP